MNPFPTDPGTLTAVEGAITTDPELGMSLDELLELLSGYTGAGNETVHDGVPIVDVGTLYSREDVILALITELRAQRTLTDRLRQGRPTRPSF